MRGGRVGGRDGPPQFAEGKPVSADNAQGKVVIGDLVEDAGQSHDGIAHGKRDRHAQEDSYR